MTDRTTVHGLQVATELFRFIEDKVLPGTGVDSAAFWVGFDQIVNDLAPKNAALLAERGIDASRPGIAVAANQKVVKRSDWAATPVSANDDIEIVQPFQGG